VRALLLDFNGTLSEDEPLLCRIFQELFAEAGRPLTEAEYYGRLAGLSDRELVRVWLGRDDLDLVERKIARYRDLADGSTVSPEAREAVLYAAERVDVAVVSGSTRSEIEPVLEAAGLAESIRVIVSTDDVAHGKPDPEGYLRALELLRVEPGAGAAIEDSDVGVAAAKAAGLYCVAVTTTFPAERLAAADKLAERVDRALISRLVSFV
jgi:beta-phosphoglucomutase